MKYEAKLIDGKMMLISRDIKVGDKVKIPQTKDNYDNNDFNIEGIVNSVGNNECNITMNNSGNITIPKKYCIKIIGEISLETTWIEDGDILDEHDLTDRNGDWVSSTPFSNYKELSAGYELRKRGIWKIAVRCPTCKKFH